jgi:hypothetical protein
MKDPKQDPDTEQTEKYDLDQKKNHTGFITLHRKLAILRITTMIFWLLRPILALTKS